MILMEPLAYRLMFYFLSFFTRNDNISFGWNFVREEWKRSPRWIRQIAEEYSLLVNPGGIHKLAGYC